MTAVYICLGLMGLLVIIILLKALFFVDITNYNNKKSEITVDDKIVENLGKLIKIPTISYEDKDKIDFSVFDKYINTVKRMFPLVFEKCEFTKTNEHAIKLKLKGDSSLNPTVLMAHYDVVPVTEGWENDPFLGKVVDGYLYGRGALDTKCTMACALTALEKALMNGYTPKNDLYLCFGSNEEVFGDSQVKIVEQFKKEGIKPALVFDEGGGIINNAFPGVKEDTAFLGVVEKGMVNVRLSIDSNGGHSSTPRKNGPIIRMNKALLAIEKHPMKPKLINTTKELLNIMGRHTSFGLKIVFANMWLFKGLVKKLFTKLSADTRALLQTTFAFTTINGGNQTNIIPNHVEANVNVRIAPFNTVDEVVNHIKKVVKDKDIKIETFNISKTYDECSFKNEGYRLIKETTIETYPNTIVSPFIMLGGTDARHYNEISSCVIRFSPIKVTNEDRKGIHGLNEKIKVETLIKCEEFYERLLLKL